MFIKTGQEVVGEGLPGTRLAISRQLISQSVARWEAVAGGQRWTVSPAVGAEEETIKRNIRKLRGGCSCLLNLFVCPGKRRPSLVICMPSLPLLKCLCARK